MNKFLTTLFLSLIFTFSIQAQYQELIRVNPANASIQSPSEYLGYELGTQFTPHYKVKGYFEYVASQSPLVKLSEYGKTYELKELVYAVVTSQENHSNLEEIRTNNLKMIGMEDGAATENKKAIVWLSYNVHGNEASSSEAAMLTLFAYAVDSEKQEMLYDVVVIMDPLLNPDGRDRYVYWNKSATGKQFNPHPETREHNEPWPGGRINHYLFDLNRDWAWQTQVESQQRVKVYQEWMPHVHVDFHEQGYNDPYYFAPAAKPFHTAISEWQREFQTTIGERNVETFDNRNQFYFTKERFDLFYPSYGDSWPTFNGAIGMTYEQAGHSRAGLGVLTAEGDTLTLGKRLTNHYLTGINTVKVSEENREKVVSEFEKYFQNTIKNGSGEYKSFVVKKSNHPDKIKALTEYLDNQNINYGAATARRAYNGFNYSTAKNERVNVEDGDLVISTLQPQGTLARVLFEPNPALEDSLTYDITAWELHHAYGLEGYALTNNIATSEFSISTENKEISTSEKPYAYLSSWKGMEDVKFLSALLKNDIKVRYAEKAFRMNEKNYEPGTLIITRRGNEHLGEKFDEMIAEFSNSYSRNVDAVNSGYVESGSDFGASSVKLIKKPKVLLLAGEQTGANNVGHIWHYFDQQIDYPVSLVNLRDLSQVKWSDYNVLVMPSGNYRDAFNDSALDELKDWIRGGGTLIALDNANGFLEGKAGFDLKRKSNDSTEEEGEGKESNLRKYEDAQRASANNLNAGSIYSISLDNSHPLAFGYGDEYKSLKLGSTAYEYLDRGWNVGVTKENALVSGFVGSSAKPNLDTLLTFGVQNFGSGKVVYMIDNPLFRGFWHNGKHFFANAVFILGGN